MQFADLPEPTFTFPQKEAADSIFSAPGESEDDVFGSAGGNKMPIPTLPEIPPTPVQPPPAAHQQQPVPVYPQPVPVPVLPIAPTPASPAAILGNPFAFEADAAPEPVASHQPAHQPVVVLTAAPTQGVLQAETVQEVEELPEDSSAHQQKKAERDRTAAGPASGINKGLFFGVVGYAVVMTLLAVYGMFIKSGEQLDPGHPLSTIPDNFGEFEPASRKKVSFYRFPVDGALPENLKARLGGKIEVGQLEIEPVKVEIRELNIFLEGRGEKQAERRGNKALVLNLRIKNVSRDLSICPMDPAFTRRERAEDKPATRLIVGNKTFIGGAINWPFALNVKRRYEEHQAEDATPLKPNESREYVVFTDADPKIENAVKEASDSLLWRVQVRRGLIEFKGKDIPVTAIIGVEFKPSDVKAD